MDPNVSVLNLKFNGADQATNVYGTKQYFFVKKGTPYVYGKPNTAMRLNQVNAHIGDTITVTLTANNVNQVKQAAYNLRQTLEIRILTNISLTPEAQKHGGQLNVTTTNPSSTTVNSNVNVTFDGTKRSIG